MDLGYRGLRAPTAMTLREPLPPISPPDVFNDAARLG
jgi:hypothetical protein